MISASLKSKLPFHWTISNFCQKNPSWIVNTWHCCEDRGSALWWWLGASDVPLAHRTRTGCKFRSKHRHAIGSIKIINDYSVSLMAAAYGLILLFVGVVFWVAWAVSEVFVAVFVNFFLVFIFSFLRMKNFKSGKQNFASDIPRQHYM